MCLIKIQLPQRHFCLRLKDSAFSYLIGFENLSKPQINNCHAVFLNSQFLDSYTCKDCKLFERAGLNGERGWTGCGCLVKTLQIIYYYFSDFFYYITCLIPILHHQERNKATDEEILSSESSLKRRKICGLTKWDWFPDASGTLRGLNSHRTGLDLRGLLFELVCGCWESFSVTCILYFSDSQDPNGTWDFQLEKMHFQLELG